MAPTLYVYYRVDAGHVPDAAAAARALQALLCSAHPGLEAHVMRRPDEQDGEVTLMETYAMPEGIDDALREHISAGPAGLSGLIRGGRHVEVFEPIG